MVPGIDLAVVGHSYYYHTTKDTVENIEPGVAQHFAENVLEIVKRTTYRPRNLDGTFAPTSLLQRVKKFDENPDLLDVPSSSPLSGSSPFASSDKGGQQHSRRPDVVFYSFFGLLVVVYSGRTAKLVYAAWGFLSIVMIWLDQPRRREVEKGVASTASAKSIKEKSNGGPSTRELNATVSSLSNIQLLLLSIAHLVYALIMAIFYANGVAFVMRSVLGRQLSWFSGEWKPVALYVWPTLLGE